MVRAGSWKIIYSCPIHKGKSRRHYKNEEKKVQIIRSNVLFASYIVQKALFRHSRGFRENVLRNA